MAIKRIEVGDDMKKLDCRGFAISTVLYGLIIMVFLIVVILVSIVSTNRKNTSDLVEIVEAELNRYGESLAKFEAISSTSCQEYVIPETGWYRIELWGAAGGSNSAYSGGKGSYTAGSISFNQGEKLYFCIGKTTTTSAGGFNGGGNAATGSSRGGGGSTDVRYSNQEINSRIMVAAGAGGATTSSQGGNGGTLIGYSWNGVYTAVTQAYGGANGIGAVGSDSAGGSGGGYFGGLASFSNYGGQGGNSYISGYAGVISKSQEDENYTVHSSGKYFVNNLMIDGVNIGDGYANIEKINEPVMINQKFKNVQFIRDCASSLDTVLWSELQAVTPDGKNVAFEEADIEDVVVGEEILTNGYIDDYLTYDKSSNSSVKCVKLNLSRSMNLNEIAVWKGYDHLKNYQQHSVLVSSNNSNWKNIISVNPDFIEDDKPTATGQHYSIYQPDYMEDDIPNGMYYIFSQLSSRRVLTFDSANDMKVGLRLLTGATNQKWVVEKQSNGYYKIVEFSTNRALEVQEQYGKANTNVVAQTTYQGYDWQLWTITSLHNGYYRIINKYNTGLAVDTTDYSQEAGDGNLVLKTLGSTKNQIFNFFKIS